MTNANFPVPQESVEAGLLAAVNQNMERWLEITTFGQEDFVAHRDVFVFIGQYLSQYGSIPSPSQIQTRFNWSPPIGDFPYWLAEMKRYSLARQIQAVMVEAYGKITEPQEALSFMLDKLSLVRSTQTNHIQATDSSALERLKMFDVRTEYIFKGDQLLGLPTGMKILDDTKVGWTPGSMVGAYGRPGVGKTWWLLWQGIHSWLKGKTILAITPEMPANMLNIRVDVLLGYQLGHTLDYNMILEGNPLIRAEYELVAKVMAQSQRWWSYDSLNDEAISVTDIAALIRQHNPDIVLVDNVSLLRSSSRGATWEQMKEICYGLKNLGTIYEVPMIITHQAVNSARGRRTERTSLVRGDDDLMPSLNDAAYGDAFVQACSDVITMCGEPLNQYINWYSIRKHRERGWSQALPTRMALVCDFAHGIMVDLSEKGYSPEAVGDEVRRILGR